jgi:hypothetical protein
MSHPQNTHLDNRVLYFNMCFKRSSESRFPCRPPMHRSCLPAHARMCFVKWKRGLVWMHQPCSYSRICETLKCKVVRAWRNRNIGWVPACRMLLKVRHPSASFRPVLFLVLLEQEEHNCGINHSSLCILKRPSDPEQLSRCKRPDYKSSPI